MCSFPFPLAMLNAVSVPLILPLSFDLMSSFRSVIELSFISMNSKSFFTVNCFASLFPMRIMFSQS